MRSCQVGIRRSLIQFGDDSIAKFIECDSCVNVPTSTARVVHWLLLSRTIIVGGGGGSAPAAGAAPKEGDEDEDEEKGSDEEGEAEVRAAGAPITDLKVGFEISPDPI